MSTTVSTTDTLSAPATPRPAALRHVLPPVAAGAVLALAAWSAALAAQRGDGDGVLVAALAMAWTLAGAVVAVRRRDEPLGLLLLGGAALAAVALAAATLLASPAGRPGTLLDAARLVQPLALGLLPAAGLHVMVGLPAGRL